MGYTGFIKKRGDAPGDLIKLDRLVGIEYELVFPGESQSVPKYVSEYSSVVVGRDGGGRELRTDPASLNELERIVVGVGEAFERAKAEPGPGCGLHIHLDAPDYQSDNDVSNLILTYLLFEKEIELFLSPDRRKSVWYRPLSRCNHEKNKAEVREFLEKKPERDKFRVSAGSIRQQPDYGTIELRHHQGERNAQEILHWINWNLHLFEFAHHITLNDVVAYHNKRGYINRLELMADMIQLDDRTREYIKQKTREWKRV